MSWLSDQGSLTRRLVNRCGRDFRVRVLSQQWVKPRIEEAQLLGISPRQQVLLRQVQLVCAGQVLVYARSIIPLNTLRGKHRRLKYLGDKPLGGYLFANPRLERTQQQLATILPRDPLFDIALSDSERDCDCIWGRRSLFRIDGKPLLVSEFFLPELVRQ
jgi:chorismate--pyruvate lyase